MHEYALYTQQLKILDRDMVLSYILIQLVV